MTTATATRGGAWLIESTTARRHVHARADDRRPSSHRADDRGVCLRRSRAGDRTARTEGLGSRPRAPAPMRRAGPAGRQRARGVRRGRARQGLVAGRLRARGALGVVWRDVRRAGQSLHRADPDVRHRRPEATVPAKTGDGRAGGRVRAQRIGVGFRRTRRPSPGHPPTRWQLHAVGREDVDHQRRLRRHRHRLRQGGRRAVFRLHRGTRLWRRDQREGRAQDGPARLVDHAGDPAGRPCASGQPAGRDRQGPQGGLQRAQLRAVEAGRDVQRGLQDRHRRVGDGTRPAAGSSGSRSRASAPSVTSSAR